MATRNNAPKALLIARLLEGSWRNSQQPVNISNEELDVIAPMILGSGAGALAWWRIKDTELGKSNQAAELRAAYRLHAVQALRYRQKIRLAFALLRANGIEPILIKGWATARLYPEAALRPYGDVDLCTAPNQYERAQAFMNTAEGRECWVDLHKGMGRLDDRSWQELFDRSQLVPLDGEEIRVLGEEDSLRISCVHFLDHGAWRPIWLCDIAAMVESIPEDFDWHACLGKETRRANWVISAMGLAKHLLNANLERCPDAVKSARLPGWLVPSVLKQWERPCVREHAPPELIMISLQHPARIPKALVNRWPNPIEATIRMKGPFNEVPRLPYQLKDYVIQTGRFLGRLTRSKQIGSITNQSMQTRRDMDHATL